MKQGAQDNHGDDGEAEPAGGDKSEIRAEETELETEDAQDVAGKALVRPWRTMIRVRKEDAQWSTDVLQLRPPVFMISS